MGPSTARRLVEQRLQLRGMEGGRLAAQLVRPETPNGRALVLLHTMFGIDERLRGFCREYAGLGYTVIAPNLYWRFSDTVALEHSPEGFSKGFENVERLDLACSVEDVRASIFALRERERALRGIGVVGYCMGGTVAVAAAARGVADMAVSYYPLKISERMNDYRSIRIPTLVHIGSLDRYASAEELSELQIVCRAQAGLELCVYPGAEHGFASHRVPSPANEAAAELAWSRNLAALARTIGP